MENLSQELTRKLPESMFPGNVGRLKSVTWNYWFQLNVEIPDDVSWDNITRFRGQFQVDADAAFLMMAISRKSFSDGTAGENAPIQMTFRDLQSSRAFNDIPLPVQAIGARALPTILPTPFLLLPASVFEAEVSSWVPAPQPTIGVANIQLSFFGYRIRMDNPEAIFSTVYGLGGR